MWWHSSSWATTGTHVHRGVGFMRSKRSWKTWDPPAALPSVAKPLRDDAQRVLGTMPPAWHAKTGKVGFILLVVAWYAAGH